jgi:hypothetical protein
VLAVAFRSDEAAMHGDVIPKARLYLGLVPTKKREEGRGREGPSIELVVMAAMAAGAPDGVGMADWPIPWLDCCG